MWSATVERTKQATRHGPRRGILGPASNSASNPSPTVGPIGLEGLDAEPIEASSVELPSFTGDVIVRREADR